VRETWIRIAIYDSVVEHAETHAAYLAYTTQHVVRLLARCPGYKNGYWADDPDGRRMAALTFWESREAIEAAAPALDRFHRDREALGVRLDSEVNFKLLPVNPSFTAWLKEAHKVGSWLRQELEPAGTVSLLPVRRPRRRSPPKRP
jgi:heme-degrading monooxygenase HmoA